MNASDQTTPSHLPQINNEISSVNSTKSGTVIKSLSNQIEINTNTNFQKTNVVAAKDKNLIKLPDVTSNNKEKPIPNLTSINLTNSTNVPSPLTPDQAMKLYMHRLSTFEHHEIFNYPQIYFVGHNAKKKHGVLVGANNNGYDDEHGSYQHVAHDHVAYRYEILKILGKGSFGQVVKAYDHKNGIHVALKMVRNEKRFAKQALEEIKILEQLKLQDKDNTRNIVHILEHFSFRNHVCMTFELLNINLYSLIKKNKFQGFSLLLVKKFAYSILVCLDLLHKNKVIHCDLKPENILLKHQGRSGIKVIDFGSSCYDHQRIYTYIQSRFYRAPEVILGGKYSIQIDMWSLGCILVEMLTGYPLFPGEDESDQLACIIEVLGMAPQSFLDQCKRSKEFFCSKGYPRYCQLDMENDSQSAKTTIGGNVYYLKGCKSKRGKYRGPPGTKSLAGIINAVNCDQNVVSTNDGESQLKDYTNFINFLIKCLEWVPEDRFTPKEALRHEWLRRKLPKPPDSNNNSNNHSSTNNLKSPSH